MIRFFGRLLCRLGIHDQARVPSISGRIAPGLPSLMDGWRCLRCPWSWGPLEWPKPGHAAHVRTDR